MPENDTISTQKNPLKPFNLRNSSKFSYYLTQIPP